MVRVAGETVAKLALAQLAVGAVTLQGREAAGNAKGFHGVPGKRRVCVGN